MLAEVLNFAGRPEQALELLEQAMRLDPHYPPVYAMELGFTYNLLGRYEEAIAALKQCLLRDPDFLAAYLHLALAYSERGQEEAARAAAEVRRLSPQYLLEVGRQTVPFKDLAVVEWEFAARRKAGLK